ncbi:hypothetical protein QQ020_12960 [Fulvivirgaceae bacterium BMA12]|uniref:Lipoprotein n=1 Tax=Agaribacillus aureus TaxID=3051825 RepID=A0ABT8L5G7_9BACT|nr:hypothetical protein [Fulvivirgaceae bacterium BMA12]
MKSPLPIQSFCLLCTLLFSVSCSPKLTSDWTRQEYQDRSFTKIAVVAIHENLTVRTKFESTAVKRFKKEGINAIEGITIFPPKMTEAQKQPKNLIKIIEENNLDGVVTMSLVSSEEGTRYRPGEDYVVPAGYSRFGKYYVQRYARVQAPGYYEPTKSYLVEAILYDLKGELYEGKETLVWSGQSSLVDPSSIESAANSFTKKMVRHMVDNQIIKMK